MCFHRRPSEEHDRRLRQQAVGIGKLDLEQAHLQLQHRRHLPVGRLDLYDDQKRPRRRTPKIRASYILSIIIRRCPEGPRRRGPMGVPPRLGLMVGRETPPTKLIKFKSTTLPRQRRRPFSLSATCMPRWAPTRHGRPSRGDQGHPRRRRGAAGLPSPGAVHLRYHGNLRA